MVEARDPGIQGSRQSELEERSSDPHLDHDQTSPLINALGSFVFEGVGGLEYNVIAKDKHGYQHVDD